MNMKKLIVVFCLAIFVSSFYLCNVCAQGYENQETQELSPEQFSDYVIQLINNERSYKGLLTLSIDPISNLVAREYANDLVTNSYFSYCDLQGKCPDERYTDAGGSGAVVEIIKGFENYEGENTKLTPLLAEYLIEALKANEDDSKVFFSPFITHVGVGAAKNDFKKILTAIVELTTVGGTFAPLAPSVSLDEEIKVSGKVNPPFKFKAISVAYYDQTLHYQEPNYDNFDNDYLIPYFPPQDHIAYGSKTKARLVKLIKTLGFIGAIGASPFTGGASAILAPVFLHSLQNSPPKEIPFEGGIKVSSNGEFNGKISLNYQSMTGLYFISVLAELENIDYPVVISRRTVVVENPLNNTLGSSR